MPSARQRSRLCWLVRPSPLLTPAIGLTKVKTFFASASLRNTASRSASARFSSSDSSSGRPSLRRRSLRSSSEGGGKGGG